MAKHRVVLDRRRPRAAADAAAAQQHHRAAAAPGAHPAGRRRRRGAARPDRCRGGRGHPGRCRARWRGCAPSSPGTGWSGRCAGGARSSRRGASSAIVQEAQVLVLAQSDPPPGHARWSLRLLSQAVGRAGGGGGHLPGDRAPHAQKNDLQPWRVRPWVTPPRHNAGFAAPMEDVLAVYARPPDPARPLVCFDETGKALRAHKRPPQRAAPGRPARQDSEYARDGRRQHLPGLRPAPRLARTRAVTARRTAVDVAQPCASWSTSTIPRPTRIVLVTDQPQRPCPRLAVPRLPARRGAAHRRALRVALHPHPWLLAEHGRDRTLGAGPAVPGPAHPRRRPRWPPRSPPGWRTATPRPPPSPGASPWRWPASAWPTSTPSSNMASLLRRCTRRKSRQLGP